MPTVPLYDNLRAAPSAGSGTLAQTGYDAQRATGEQLQRTGAALSDVGTGAGRIALDMADIANQARVNDAVNQARVAAQNLTFDPTVGFKSQLGLAALKRDSGQALPEEYGAKLQSALTGLASGLDNDQQRRMFQPAAGSIATGFHGDVESHMLGEFKNYRVTTYDATVNLASDDAKRNWSDPVKITAALDAAKAATFEKYRLLGLQGAPTDAALLATTSKVHHDVVLSALENNNPTYALGYLDRNKGQMTADDILRLQGHVNQQVWAGQVQDAVSKATTAVQPQIAPTSFDRLVQITAQSESGGRETNPDGSTVTSPKGALGIMQVMPATMKNPGLGLKGIDPATATPGQRAAFGQNYLQALLQKYGDPAKAWAAYNGGFGAVDKALEAAAKDRAVGAYHSPGGQPSDAWLGKMPAETQAYVAKNMAAFESGGGKPARPSELDFVNIAVGQLPPGSPPQVVAKTRQQAEQQFVLIYKSLKDADDRSVVAALQAGEQVGWRFSALPVSVRSAIPPEKIDDVMGYYQKRFKGDDVTDPATYQRLSSPAELTRISDNAFFLERRNLSEVDFKKFANERAGLLSPKPEQHPGSLGSASIKSAVDENLRVLKIDPSPKDDGGNDAARIGGIRKFVDDEIGRAQALAGKKFTDTEVRTEVSKIFARQGAISSWIGSATAAQMLTMRAGDIPSKAADKLRADFAANGIASPTDAQLLGAYWNAKSLADDAKRPAKSLVGDAKRAAR